MEQKHSIAAYSSPRWEAFARPREEREEDTGPPRVAASPPPRQTQHMLTWSRSKIEATTIRICRMSGRPVVFTACSWTALAASMCVPLPFQKVSAIQKKETPGLSAGMPHGIARILFTHEILLKPCMECPALPQVSNCASVGMCGE